MEILWFVLIGLAAGYLAGVYTKGKGFGLVGNLIVGVVGAIVGGEIFRLLGFSRHGKIALFVTAFIGAVVLLAVIKVVFKRR